MGKIISGLLLVVAFIHLLPVSGVLGVERLSTLYGIGIQDPNLEILMRHRAVLFGLLAVFLGYAAFRPTVQPLALIAGFISVLSFVIIAWSVGEYNDALNKVFIADIIATVLLVLASVAYFLRNIQFNQAR